MWLDTVGQENIRRALTHLAQSNALHHALIFHGVEGFGMDTIAIRFAQMVVKNSSSKNFLDNPNIKFIIALPRGKNETDTDGPMDKIPAAEFEKIKSELGKKELNPYYQLDIPNANDIKINSIRDIQKYLTLKPECDQKRVIIISEADLMNEAAQNALLKNLEEPPENTYFILTTTKLNQLRETIRSRCQEFQFSPLSESEMEEILTKFFEIGSDSAHMVSRIAEGSYTKALEMLESDVNFFLEKTISILRYGLVGKYYSCLQEINEIGKKDEKDFKQIIRFIIYWLYELRASRDGKIPYYFVNQQETIDKFNLKYGQINLTEIIKDCEYLLYQITNTNVNINVLKFRLVMLLSSIMKIKK
ncbi:MAG: AAA family ATPase [Ignavibacteriaceae bacterium]|jgi:DNA polymerase-3 subunit delta'